METSSNPPLQPHSEHLDRHPLRDRDSNPQSEEADQFREVRDQEQEYLRDLFQADLSLAARDKVYRQSILSYQALLPDAQLRSLLELTNNPAFACLIALLRAQYIPLEKDVYSPAGNTDGALQKEFNTGRVLGLRTLEYLVNDSISKLQENIKSKKSI